MHISVQTRTFRSNYEVTGPLGFIRHPRGQWNPIYSRVLNVQQVIQNRAGLRTVANCVLPVRDHMKRKRHGCSTKRKPFILKLRTAC